MFLAGGGTGVRGPGGRGAIGAAGESRASCQYAEAVGKAAGDTGEVGNTDGSSIVGKMIPSGSCGACCGCELSSDRTIDIIVD